MDGGCGRYSNVERSRITKMTNNTDEKNNNSNTPHPPNITEVTEEIMIRFRSRGSVNISVHEGMCPRGKELQKKGEAKATRLHQ